MNLHLVYELYNPIITEQGNVLPSNQLTFPVLTLQICKIMISYLTQTLELKQ